VPEQHTRLLEVAVWEQAQGLEVDTVVGEERTVTLQPEFSQPA